MTVFVVLGLGPADKLASAIATTFPQDNLQVAPNGWLISTTGTSKELSDKLKITAGDVGSAMVFATAGYFGRASTNYWEWIKTKLEAKSG